MSLIHYNNEDFNQLIQGPTLVDFYAEWCGPCKMISPILEEISNSREDVKIVKINVDENPELARQYKVMSIPTMIMFNNGIEKEKHIGFLPKEEIENLIQNNL